MEKIKIGVIGVGHLGRFHAKLYKELPGVELVGVFDPDMERSRLIGEEVGVTIFSDAGDLLDAVDGVSIAAPTSKHFAVARQAVMKNCHIFVEKPVASSITQAQDLVKLAKEKELIFQVGHIERFNGALMALEGIKIEPLFIEAHRLAGFTSRGADVAVVLDLMIHDIDLILSIVKSPIKNLSASGAAIISTTEDIANCRITFENGCVANITSSRISAKKMRKMRIFQKNAYFSIDFNEGFTEVYHTKDLALETTEVDHAISLGALEESKKPKEILYSRLSRNDVNALKLECQNFVDSIREKRDPIVTGFDGLNALTVADMILREIENHKSLVNSRKE